MTDYRTSLKIMNEDELVMGTFKMTEDAIIFTMHLTTVTQKYNQLKEKCCEMCIFKPLS